MDFRLLVAYSRTWDDGYTAFRVLNEILNEQGNLTLVIPGAGTRGPSAIFKMWAQCHPPGILEYHLRPGVPGRHLVDTFRPHLVAAFLTACDRDWCPQRGLHWDHAADETVQYARAKGVQVRTLENVRL